MYNNSTVVQLASFIMKQIVSSYYLALIVLMTLLLVFQCRFIVNSFLIITQLGFCAIYFLFFGDTGSQVRFKMTLLFDYTFVSVFCRFYMRHSLLTYLVKLSL